MTDRNLPSSGSFLTKHTTSSQVKLGWNRLSTSLGIVQEEKEKMDREDRRKFLDQYDILARQHSSLIPKSRFPQSVNPVVVKDAHDFARAAKTLMIQTQTTQDKFRRLGLDTTIPTAEESIPVGPGESDRLETPSSTIPHSSVGSNSTLSGGRDLLSPSSSNSWRTIHSPGTMIPEGITVIEDVQPLSDPIRGGFSDVWMYERVCDGKRQNVGVKVIRCSEDADVESYNKIVKRLFCELRIWQPLHHPHVLKLYGVCHTSSLFPGIVSPWMANGHVGKYLKHQPNIKISDRLSLVSQAASGLQYLHEHNPPIVHGDLKAANVLVDDRGNACLADFGLSRLFEEHVTALSSTFPGSLRWMAPELFGLRPRISLNTDIYSFGSLMLEVLGGHIPYHYLENGPAIVYAIAEAQLPLRPNCPEPCNVDSRTCAAICDAHWEYMNVCWSGDPTKRPNIIAVRSQLEKFKAVEAT